MRVRKNDTGQLSADADSVTYGDAITATAVLPMDATATSVSFSVNGGAAQVVEADENGAASISFNTASFEGLVVGQNIVGASYVQEDGNGGTTTVTATASIAFLCIFFPPVFFLLLTICQICRQNFADFS